MLLNETFDVFSRIAALRSSKKLTGKEVDKLFGRLTNALTKYYDLADEALQQQRDLMQSTLKTFEGSKSANLPVVKELKNSYDKTVKASALTKQLKTTFNNAKQKAYDFEFNADKEGALKITNYEDQLKSLMNKTFANVQKAEDDIVQDMAKKQQLQLPQGSKEQVAEPIKAPWDKKGAENKKDVIDAPWDKGNAAQPAQPAPAPAQPAPAPAQPAPAPAQPAPAQPAPAPAQPAPAQKDIKAIKTDNDIQQKLSKILDEFIAKNSGLIAEAYLMDEAIENVLIKDILSDENLKKFSQITFKNKDQRKNFSRKLKEFLASNGYTISALQLAQPNAKPAAQPAPAQPAPAPSPAPVKPAAAPSQSTDALPIAKDILEKAKLNKDYENLKSNFEKYLDANKLATTAKNQSVKDENTLLAKNLRNNITRFQQLVPELKGLSLPDLEKVLKS